MSHPPEPPIDATTIELLLDAAHRLTEHAGEAMRPHASEARHLAREIYAFASAQGSAEATRRLAAASHARMLVDPDDLDWVAPQGG